MPKIEPFDVVVIGGGINGCGTFYDLCLQGVRVLLLERDDFCAGASAASSRLLHGGLKYLETGEFGLVRESLTERNMLLAIAPHYTEPLECIVPVKSVWGGVLGLARRFLGSRSVLRDRGLVITALGLTLYDAYGRSLRAMPPHRMLSRRRLHQALPALAPGFIGAGAYFEGHITHAERLGLELVLDGETARPGSEALNHAVLLGADDGVLRFRHRGRLRQVRARSIVNAGGAWIDRVNATLGLATRLTGGSRGSHLVVKHPGLLTALGGRMVYFGTPDGRINLLYPFAGHVLVGATDIAQPDPDCVACGDDEVRYLCDAVRRVFPDLPIRAEHIVHRFCGVRPLPRFDGDVGRVSRDHSIATLELPEGVRLPVHCLIGGKWTTFRAFAEQATDRVLADLDRRRVQDTAGLAIGGGRGFPRDAAARAKLAGVLASTAGVSPARADRLLSRYGTRARAYATALAGRGETMLATLDDFAREEILHIAATERVGSLDDLLFRRTLIGLTGRATTAVRAEVAALLARGGAATGNDG